MSLGGKRQKVLYTFFASGSCDADTIDSRARAGARGSIWGKGLGRGSFAGYA